MIERTCENCGGRDRCKVILEPGKNSCRFWKPELVKYGRLEAVECIDRAAILRLCNEIEDVFGELCEKHEFPIYYYSEIMKRLKAIGKELTGDAGGKTD